MKNVRTMTPFSTDLTLMHTPLSSVTEKQIRQSPETNRRDRETTSPSRKVTRHSREREREGPTREGEVRGGETEEGGGSAVQTRTDTESAVRSRPEDGAVCVLQGGNL